MGQSGWKPSVADEHRKFLSRPIRQSDVFQTTLLFITQEEVEADEEEEIEKSWKADFGRRH
jgi:hypothetical protein